MLARTIPIAFPVTNPTTRLIRRLGAVPAFHPLRIGYARIHALQDRQRVQVLAEMTQIEGLMPLLMKQRNGTPWTGEDRKRIRGQLRSLARLSPYILALLLPGGLLALPVIAWWLDRRRLRRDSKNTAIQ